ncbi:unnamed protein product, partial [Musa acuminata subsp. malaccensis]
GTPGGCGASPSVDEGGAAGLEPAEPVTEGGPHLALRGVRVVPRHPSPPPRLRVAGPRLPRRGGGGGTAGPDPATVPPPGPQRRSAGGGGHGLRAGRRAVGPDRHPVAPVVVGH